MRHDYTEEFDRIRLLPLSASAAEQMRILRNKHSRSFFTTREISPDEQQKWYENYLFKPNDYMFSVYLKEQDIWVGAVAIYDVDLQQKTAEFGRIIIDKEAAGLSGLGYDTTMAACKFAFEQLGLKNVHLDVYSDNYPAVHTYIKAGFHEYAQSTDSQGRRILLMHKNQL